MSKQHMEGTPLKGDLENRAQEIFEAYINKGGNISAVCRRIALLERDLAEAKKKYESECAGSWSRISRMQSLEKQLVAVTAERDRLRQACEQLVVASVAAKSSLCQSHQSHWDSKGTHGANCPACIENGRAVDALRPAITKAEAALTPRGGGGSDEAAI